MRDDPDVLCLQELPLWSVERLEAWSGMGAFSARTRHRLGRLGRRPTDIHYGRFRLSLTGQANAAVARRHAVADHRRLVLNSRLFVAREARRLASVFASHWRGQVNGVSLRPYASRPPRATRSYCSTCT